MIFVPVKECMKFEMKESVKKMRANLVCLIILFKEFDSNRQAQNKQKIMKLMNIKTE